MRRLTEPPPYDEEAGRLRAVAELAVIAQEHTLFPTCRLCGQSTRALDEYGLCSKTSEPHEQARREGTRSS